MTPTRRAACLRWLWNHLFASYSDIRNGCCQAWNNLITEIGRIASIGRGHCAKIGKSQ
jgi:hypothetical protein